MSTKNERAGPGPPVRSERHPLNAYGMTVTVTDAVLFVRTGSLGELKAAVAVFVY
jgi:hypothetical protein